jgi:hypothetical protein
VSETPEQVDGDQPGEDTHGQVTESAPEPLVAEPVVGEPVVGEPVVGEPVVAEPVVAEPVVAEPVVAEPVVAEPVVPEPVVPEPVVPEPVVPTPADIPSHEPEIPTPATVAEAMTPPVDRSEWGYVNDEGTVFVRTPAGDREIGSWKAGPPAEALEFYGRRYDGLAVEVDLLEHRIRDTDVSEKEARTAIERIKLSLVDVAAIGDLAALDARLAALEEVAKARAAQARAARAKVIAEAKVLKERIVADVEAVGAGSEWRVGGDRIRALLDEWKAAPRLDRKSDDELWTRFSAARSAFSKRRKAHYGELTATREAAKAAKEALVAKAEGLANSTDWGATSDAFRNMMKEWKAAGRAAKDVDDALWERFKAAQDQFFSSRNNAFAAKDAELTANLAAKEALVVEAEKLVPVTNAASARSALRGIQERWDKSGPLPREQRGRIEGRLSAVEAAVREAEELARQRSNPAAKARAQETVDSLLAAIAKYEKQAEKARTAGNTKALADAEDSVAARKEWLAEAQRMLAEFS